MSAAPYPADTRAKGWRFELDYEQIEQSSTWALAGPEARPWLLMLWMTSWRQVPCGSLPAEHEVIAAMIGMTPKTWAKVGPVLLRGWSQADDGRLYHATISQRVLEMLDYRAKQAKRVADFKLRQREERAANALPTSEQPASNDTGTGTGTVKDISSATHSHPPAKAGGKTPTVPCPYQAIVDLYHAALPNLPRVKLMPAARQRALRKTWGWVLSSTKGDGTRRAETADQAMDWLQGYFARAAENDFLMGRGPRSGEHAGWQCDLDFLLTDRGMKHVIEKTQEAA